MYDPEQIERQLAHDVAQSRALIDVLLQEDMLDEDGYPTEAALLIVEKWHWTDAKGWFEFIRSIWAYSDWGWREVDEPHEIFQDRISHRYKISTAGWSGNESIITAMKANQMMWSLNWVQSRRGGHYIFELKTFDDER